MTNYFFRSVLILTYYVFFCFASHAETLEKALDTALENNSEMKLEKSRLDQVKATRGQAFADFLPDVNATYQRGRQKNDAAGLQRGDLDKMNDQDVRQVNVNQPIFSGFSGYHNLKEIDATIQSAEEYYQSKQLDILLQATESYLTLFKARKLLALKKDDEEINKRILQLIEDRNILGEVGGSEVMKYQTFVSSATSDTLTAQRNLFQAEEEFRKIFGQIDSDLLLPIIDQSEPLDSEEDLVTLAMLENPTLKTYLFKIKAAKFARKESKGKFLPIVEISASASEQQNVTYLNNADLKSEAVYLNVKVPLFQKGIEYSGLNQANKDLVFAKREYQTQKETIIGDVKKTRREISFFLNLIESQQNLITLTQSRIANIEEQVKVGSGDIIDLLESKLERNKMSIQMLQNQSDYVLSYYKLLMLTGKFSL